MTAHQQEALLAWAMACLTECPAAASSGLTNAPTEIIEEVVPPGAPTEERAGPELPAELTNITPCLFTTCTKLWISCKSEKISLLRTLVIPKITQCIHA